MDTSVPPSMPNDKHAVYTPSPTQIAALNEPGAIHVDVTPDAATVRLHLAGTVLTWPTDRSDASAMADVTARLAAALYTVTQLLSYPGTRTQRAHATTPDA